MILKEVTKASELGRDVEFVREGTSLKEVIFFIDGKEVRIRQSDYYHIKVFVRDVPAPVIRHELCGTVNGVEVAQVFDSEDAAREAREKFDLSGLKCDLQIDEVEVPVNEDGQPLAVVECDIPF